MSSSFYCLYTYCTIFLLKLLVHISWTQYWENNFIFYLLKDMQKKSFEEKYETFMEICQNFQPVFRYFCMEKFLDPAVWFEKRLAYTRSVATSSIGNRLLHFSRFSTSCILCSREMMMVIMVFTKPPSLDHCVSCWSWFLASKYSSSYFGRKEFLFFPGREIRLIIFLLYLIMNMSYFLFHQCIIFWDFLWKIIKLMIIPFKLFPLIVTGLLHTTFVTLWY